jgi:hypothetical protein
LARHLLHDWVARFVSGTRSKRLLVCHNRPRGFVQAQELPADGLVADASTANLPDPHDGVVFFGEANSMDLDGPDITIILKLQNVA